VDLLHAWLASLVENSVGTEALLKPAQQYQSGQFWVQEDGDRGAFRGQGLSLGENWIHLENFLDAFPLPPLEPVRRSCIQLYITFLRDHGCVRKFCTQKDSVLRMDIL
jgi:hypothetical protein